MKHYTDTISVTLAEKLKEKGMPIVFPKAIFYSEVFDWLMEKGIYIRIVPFLNRIINCYWEWYIDQEDEPDIPIESDFYFDSWHEAAEKAIEKALPLI